MNKILGLAKRARKLMIGTELVIKGISNKKVYLVLIANEASDNTKNQLINKCSYYETPYLLINECLINQAIGTTNVKVIGITEEGFTKLILNKKGM